ncbi:hypothetical protein [Actinomadura sp. K4S16]|uniref:hypothetical protein n=1 Tax=Actinomadura sp. K4S16 TaxID=1316147 RepID=UPI0011EF6D13|nr:hypothetical protein [Actinomadura sp. K4S16]
MSGQSFSDEEIKRAIDTYGASADLSEDDARARLIRDLQDLDKIRHAPAMAEFVKQQGIARPWHSVRERISKDGLSARDALRAEREQALKALIDQSPAVSTNGVLNESEVAAREGARLFLRRTDGLLDAS